MTRKPPETAPEAPQHLNPATKAWYAQVVSEYALEAHHLRLLRLAAESWDRGQEAREILEREGLTCVDRFGMPKARPEVKIEADSRIAFARLLRELCLDLEEPAETRPPRRTGKH